MLIRDQLVTRVCSNAHSERMTTHEGYQVIDRPSSSACGQQGVGKSSSLLLQTI